MQQQAYLTQAPNPTTLNIHFLNPLLDTQLLEQPTYAQLCISCRYQRSFAKPHPFKKTTKTLRLQLNASWSQASTRQHM